MLKDFQPLLQRSWQTASSFSLEHALDAPAGSSAREKASPFGLPEQRRSCGRTAPWSAQLLPWRAGAANIRRRHVTRPHWGRQHAVGPKSGAARANMGRPRPSTKRHYPAHSPIALAESRQQASGTGRSSIVRMHIAALTALIVQAMPGNPLLQCWQTGCITPSSSAVELLKHVIPGSRYNDHRSSPGCPVGPPRYGAVI